MSLVSFNLMKEPDTILGIQFSKQILHARKRELVSNTLRTVRPLALGFTVGVRICRMDSGE